MNKYKVTLTVVFVANVQEENKEKAVELLAKNIPYELIDIIGIKDAGIYKVSNVAMECVSSKVVEIP